MGTDAEGKTAGKAHVNKAIPGRLLRGTLVAAGTFFLALGVVGIFIPLLPTTPFLLLAAACYARGSKRLHDWLLGNRFFGRHIRNYREGKGVPPGAKALSLAFLWANILISAWWFVSDIYTRAALIAISMAVSAHILAIRTLRE